MDTNIPKTSDVRCGFKGCKGPIWCNSKTCPAIIGGGICCWIFDCKEEDRRLGRKPRSNYWLR